MCQCLKDFLMLNCLLSHVTPEAGLLVLCSETHGCCIVQQAKVENLQRLYEIDDHPERRAWLDKLLSFMEDRGTPISQCPTISKNPLDLYRLYMYTKDRGGFLEVCITLIGYF